ncbi:YwgA family protein [Brevibacillus humidisoli]|uniref:YwgA family protein n=1 Tax=Brevibacillus humidisoli TaxID=2895522 RepID=UPI001E4AE034|nr:YwgA family protein [Brevibacillus humidisoli]UFJ40226.1 YwgA family protein [Brevibacillus humidisoli]
MFKGHAKIVRLVEVLGEVTGRKKLHKMVYIAKKMQVDFDDRFEFHMYGPYSEELTVRVDELCSLGLLDEQKESKGAIEVYRYTVNDAGREFLQHQDVDLGGGEPLFRRMNEENSRFLELVSTILFFDYLPYDEMKTKVFTLKSKQRYTEEEIDRALAFIEEIRVIHIA